MTDAFFTVDRRPGGTEWFLPTELARGPWDPDACHGGPPSGLLARELERAMPAVRLARMSVDLGRQVPMAGFTIVAEVVRSGRGTANTTAAIIDADGRARVTATGVHVAVAATPILEGHLDNSATVTPRLAESSPGEFPVRHTHGMRGFRDAVEVRYPSGEDNTPGATTLWMRTVPLLDREAMTPFQRICPLADCGNAFARHAEPDQVQFINTDLVVALHRDPVGEWMGSRATSVWQPTGAGLAEALLFDDEGPVGRALQTLLVRKP